MAKQMLLRLPDDLYQKIKKTADYKQLSVNRFIVSALSENIAEAGEEQPDVSVDTGSLEEAGKIITYRFPKSYGALVRQKASQLGLTDTAYLRQMIRSKDFKRIDYSLDDLWENMSQSQKLIDSVVRFVDFINTSGKGQVFEPDIRKILSLLEDIKALHKKQIQLAHSNREKVYRKMIRKIEDEL